MPIEFATKLVDCKVWLWGKFVGKAGSSVLNVFHGWIIFFFVKLFRNGVMTLFRLMGTNDYSSKIITDVFPPWSLVNTSESYRPAKCQNFSFYRGAYFLLMINELSTFDYLHLAATFPLNSRGNSKGIFSFFTYCFCILDYLINFK